ncbi:hypothetical protein PMAYCL1PPCAC_23749, partial [Pristionchus mayeri]
ICSLSTYSGEIFNCYPSYEWNSIPCEDCQVTGFCSPSSNSTFASACYCREDSCLTSMDEMMVTVQSSSLAIRDGGRMVCTKWTGECHPREEWILSSCGRCDWRGECIPTLHPHEQCICRDSKCYSASSSRVLRKGSMRVSRESRKTLEKSMSRYEALMAVYSHCRCGSVDCHGLMEKSAPPESEVCLCFYNKNTASLWPCYQPEKWKGRRCNACSTMGNCPFSSSLEGEHSCLCVDEIKMCVRYEGMESGSNWTTTAQLVNFWDISPTTTQSPFHRKKEKADRAFGYKGVSDPIALKAKAVENVIFSVQGLENSEKEALGYSKKEFITKCSFNGRECTIDKDFSIHLDPVYGNCYTFGRNDSEKKDEMTSERAGPQYGLRFQVFVNVSDYLPTTEAAGVRLTVHSSDEQPFPDTLGFSAPTGFVSSFGIRLKQMTRLPAPYGECTPHGKDQNFIYPDKNYSTEACQRGCLQRYLIELCGCGDPRYPALHLTPNCPVDDPHKRNCLANGIKSAIYNMTKDGCSCPQPCRQKVYSVSYSASRWPTLSSMVQSADCPTGLAPHLCLEYFREQGALIEVFFEQLNYEALVETEAYGITNLLSDFGGQLGLWMGVSVITISEVAILLLDILTSILCCGKSTARKLSSRQRSLRGSARNSEYLLNRSSVHDNHVHSHPSNEGKRTPVGHHHPFIH